MSIFVDTSAFLAVLDSREQRHAEAREAWQQIIQDDQPIGSTLAHARCATN